MRLVGYSFGEEETMYHAKVTWTDCKQLKHSRLYVVLGLILAIHHALDLRSMMDLRWGSRLVSLLFCLVDKRVAPLFSLY